jgi:hypothetical protein
MLGIGKGIFAVLGIPRQIMIDYGLIIIVIVIIIVAGGSGPEQAAPCR